MARRLSCPSWEISLSACVLAVMLGMVALARAQEIKANWQQPVRVKADAHRLDAALTLVDQRLAQVPSDLEARGWRGRFAGLAGAMGTSRSRVSARTRALAERHRRSLRTSRRTALAGKT